MCKTKQFILCHVDLEMTIETLILAIMIDITQRLSWQLGFFLEEKINFCKNFSLAFNFETQLRKYVF